VASGTEEVHYFAPDETRAAQDDYFHILIFGLDALTACGSVEKLSRAM
jgi:hypothetical protein